MFFSFFAKDIKPRNHVNKIKILAVIQFNDNLSWICVIHYTLITTKENSFYWYLCLYVLMLGRCTWKKKKGQYCAGFKKLYKKIYGTKMEVTENYRKIISNFGSV